LQRFLLLELWVSELKHCEVVSAYDLSVDFTDGGRGSESIAYTLVLRTIVLQHSSCSVSTAKGITIG